MAGVGYSVEFIRSWLSLWALVAVVALLGAALNELLDLGLFAGGYPVLGGTAGFGAFAVQAVIAVIALLALSALLSVFER